MLFDLRGSGRRRTVRVIYMGLAILMGVGLVGFGIGSFGGGGLLNAASNNGGSNSASFSSQIKKYRKLTQEQPKNAGAWEKLTAAQLHEAGGEAYFSNNQLTSKGTELFTQTANSWLAYLALNPPNPNPELAKRMVLVFGQEGLNEPAQAVQTLQIVVAAQPTSASWYAELARYAYLAHNPRVGDLAAAKAVSLAEPAQQARLKLALAKFKKNPTGSEPSTATAGATLGAKGTSTTSATAPATSSTAPAGQTSSTKK